MAEEIIFDPEDASVKVNGKLIEVTRIDFSQEWLTTDCIESAYTSIETTGTTFEEEVSTMTQYIASLNAISGTEGPDVPAVDDTDVDVVDEVSTPTPTVVEETPTPTVVEETPTPTAVEETPTPTAVEETPTPTTVEETPTSTTVEETPTPTVEEETSTPTPPSTIDAIIRYRQQHVVLEDAAVVNQNNVEFRLTSNNDDAVLQYLDDSTKLTIIGTEVENGMIKVRLTDGTEGYVPIETLVLKSDAEVLETLYPIAEGKVNIDIMFTTNSECDIKVCEIKPGDSLDVIGYSKDLKMAKVRTTDGLEGYVSVEYLY